MTKMEKRLDIVVRGCSVQRIIMMRTGIKWDDRVLDSLEVKIITMITEEKQGTVVQECLEVGVIMMIKSSTEYRVVYHEK